MKKHKKREMNRDMTGRKPVKTGHTKNDIGLPEDIRVVHSGEPNPNDGQ